MPKGLLLYYGSLRRKGESVWYRKRYFKNNLKCLKLGRRHKSTGSQSSLNFKQHKYKEIPSRHIIIQELKSKDKERKILKTTREKHHVTYRGITI